MLNPSLDVAALVARYRDTRRLVIRDFLTPQAAEQISNCLEREVNWGLAYLDGGVPRVIERAGIDAMTQAERDALDRGIAEQALKGFQYRYRCYPMVDAYLQRRDPHLALHQVFEFINSPLLLDAVRRITGCPQIVRADAQATLYAPGDFLTLHNDFDAQKGRLVAYVMGFSKNWRPDYGGVLQFLDDAQNIECGFLPRFNSLMLFSVPQNHAVSCVAPFAPLGRYSVTGWFQDATAVPPQTKARYGLSLQGA
jgi:Rps23 Pro-64 3,4-dihydroxylase Tpa1-like proline 4-hydroxylase